MCFTVDAILEPENPITWLWMAREELAGCEVASEHIAVIRFKNPALHPKDHLGFAVLPAHRFESPVIPPSHPIGREAWGSTGMHARVSRERATFTSAREVHESPFRISEWTIVPNKRVDDLLTGDVHGLVTVDPDARARIQNRDNIHLKSFDLRTFWYVAIRESGPLADREVRRKLDAAIQREALLRDTQSVDAQDPNPPLDLISGPFVQSSPLYNRAVEPRVHEASDLSGLTLRLGIPARQHADDPKILEGLAEQWRAMGAQIEAVIVDADPMTWAPEAAAVDVDLLIVSVEEPMRALESRRDHLFGTGGRNNPLGLSNDGIDALLAEGRNARTAEGHRTAMHTLHQRMQEEVHAFFLWKRDTKSAWSNAIRNNILAPGLYYTDAAGWRFE